MIGNDIILRIVINLRNFFGCTHINDRMVYFKGCKSSAVNQEIAMIFTL